MYDACGRVMRSNQFSAFVKLPNGSLFCQNPFYFPLAIGKKTDKDDHPTFLVHCYFPHFPDSPFSCCKIFSYFSILRFLIPLSRKNFDKAIVISHTISIFCQFHPSSSFKIGKLRSHSVINPYHCPLLSIFSSWIPLKL